MQSLGILKIFQRKIFSFNNFDFSAKNEENSFFIVKKQIFLTFLNFGFSIYEVNAVTSLGIALTRYRLESSALIRV
jgi:hypothetical protein